MLSRLKKYGENKSHFNMIIYLRFLIRIGLLACQKYLYINKLNGLRNHLRFRNPFSLLFVVLYAKRERFTLILSLCFKPSTGQKKSESASTHGRILFLTQKQKGFISLYNSQLTTPPKHPASKSLFGTHRVLLLFAYEDAQYLQMLRLLHALVR